MNKRFYIILIDIVISLLFLLNLMISKNDSSIYFGVVYIVFPIVIFMDCLISVKNRYFQNFSKLLITFLITILLMAIGSCYGKTVGWYDNVDSTPIFGLFTMSYMRIIVIVFLTMVFTIIKEILKKMKKYHIHIKSLK